MEADLHIKCSLLSSHGILFLQVGIFKSGFILQSMIAIATSFSYKLVYFGDHLLHILFFFKNVWGKHASITGRSIPARRGRCLCLREKDGLGKEKIVWRYFFFHQLLFFFKFALCFKVLSNVSCGDLREFYVRQSKWASVTL